MVRLKFPITSITMMTNNTANNNMIGTVVAGAITLRAAANGVGGRIVSGSMAENLMVNLQV